LSPETNCLIWYFHKNTTFFSVGLLRIGQVFCVSCETVYRLVTTDCSFMSDFFCWVRQYRKTQRIATDKKSIFFVLLVVVLVLAWLVTFVLVSA
jgi:hypothetical protein